MPHHRVRRIASAFGAVTIACSAVVGLAATPAAADQGVQVTVAYGQSTYKSDDTFSVTLTITNGNDFDLEFAQAQLSPGSGDCVAGVFGWPKLGNTFTVPAHGTVTDTETGPNPIQAGLAGTATCAGTVTASELFAPIPYSTSVNVTQAFGTYSGVLFRDRNHDGMFEPGEGIGGITVTAELGGGFNDVSFTTTSGPDGRFAFSQMPVGNYFVLFSSKRNWVIDSPDVITNGAEVTVTETGPPAVFLPVIPPLSDKLHVKFAFDQPSYQPTDTAHLTITLTNTSKSAITGVIADCNRVGDPNGLDSFDGWGALSQNGPGATIPAGSTQTFHVDQPIPSGTQQLGYVHAPCEFGPEPNGLPQVGFPEGDPSADVPGLTSAVLLETAQENGTAVTPIPGVHVELLNFVTHAVVVSAVSDANGQISLPALPANHYVVRITGKWKLGQPGSGVLLAISPGSLTNARIYDVVPRA